MVYFLYSRATKGGGALVKSTSAGGGVVNSTSSGGGSSQTSSSGGGVSTSTQSGGGSTQTSSSGGGTSTTSGQANGYPATIIPYMTGMAIPDGSSHIHGVTINTADFDHWHTVNVPAHTHSVSVPAHSHNFSLPNHSHSVTVPNHSHQVTVPEHSHDIDLPNHTHEIEFGIFKLSQMPTAVTIKVDGNTVPHTATSGDNIDLVPYLSRTTGGRIRRGQWHTVEITPNRLGRITAQLTNQFFIQSRGGGEY